MEWKAAGRELSMASMTQPTSVVFVVDDDVSVRESLELLIRCEGWQPELFASATEFLSSPRPRPSVPSCLVLDVSMPGLNGVEMAIQIGNSYPSCKILLFSGHASTADILESAKQRGYCFELLTKPVHPRDLLAAIRSGTPKEVHPAPEPAEQQDFQAA